MAQLVISRGPKAPGYAITGAVGISCFQHAAAPWRPLGLPRKVFMCTGYDMNFLDCHCHLQDPRLGPYLEDALRLSRNNNVLQFICNSTCEDDWESVSSISARNDGVLPAYGFHPWYIGSATEGWESRLRQRILQDPRSSIGESGLDKNRSKSEGCEFPKQQLMLEEHLRIAQELRVPVTLHCVGAHGKLFEVMKTFGYFPAGVVLHSYSGSADMVLPFSKLNSYFSFSASCLHQRNRKVRDAMKAVPLDRLLLESDCPDQPPPPTESAAVSPIIVPGQVSSEVPEKSVVLNTPAVVPLIAQCYSELHEGVTLEDVRVAVANNATRVFRPRSA